MKNLDFALRVLAQVQSAVQFTIVGPREDPRYWKECEALLADLPNHIRVIDAGPVVADDVPGVLAAQDLFFLPTRGENYGHALVEAWCAGLPVLTSDQTPWRNLETKGVGWDIPLDTPEAFVGIIDLVARWTSTAAEAVHQRCAAFGVDVATDLEAVDANRSMLDSLCNQGGGPGGQDGHDMHCEREDHGVV